MSPKEVISFSAPAKLNLGLEVLGRRPDGYHELATIFLAVDLVDTLEFIPATTLRVHCSSPALSRMPNLVMDALLAAQGLAKTDAGAHVTLRKGIPVAAGLGGASSDAATTLIGCQELWNTEFSTLQLQDTAVKLGSDVPFFLLAGCALGRGRGELLEPLRLSEETWFVLVSPGITIPNKTSTLYNSLRASDFTDGSQIFKQAQRVQRSGMLDSDLLVNAFTRALYERVPSLSEVAAVMTAAGADSVSLSGAGPTHYTVERDPERAYWIADRLRDVLRSDARVSVVRPLPARSEIELNDGAWVSLGAPK